LRGSEVAGTGLPYTQTILKGRDACRMQLQTGSFLFGSPTTVMYRSDVVRSRVPFYSEGRLHEDTEACYEILKEWDFGVVHQILSYSRGAEASYSGSIRQYDSGILDRLICIDRYGSAFLPPVELENLRDEVERRYYRQQARTTLLGAPPGFWNFHR